MEAGKKRLAGDAVQAANTDEIKEVADVALQQTELSPHALAATLTDQERCVVSQSTVHRSRKAHDLMTRPAFIAQAPVCCVDAEGRWVNQGPEQSQLPPFTGAPRKQLETNANTETPT